VGLSKIYVLDWNDKTVTNLVIKRVTWSINFEFPHEMELLIESSFQNELGE
jgi:hypothetical protein